MARPSGTTGRHAHQRQTGENVTTEKANLKSILAPGKMVNHLHKASIILDADINRYIYDNLVDFYIWTGADCHAT